MQRVALVAGIAGAVIGGALAFDSDTYHQHQGHQKYVWFCESAKARDLARAWSEELTQRKVEERRREKVEIERRREESEVHVPPGLTLDPPTTQQRAANDGWVEVPAEKPSPFTTPTSSALGSNPSAPDTLPADFFNAQEQATHKPDIFDRIAAEERLKRTAAQIDVQENGVASASMDYTTGAITTQLISGRSATAETPEPDLSAWLRLASVPALGFLIPWSVLWLLTWLICGFFVEVPDHSLKSSQDSGSPQ
jgi:hypothetical protein